jgi:hypothetical protein
VLYLQVNFGERGSLGAKILTGEREAEKREPLKPVIFWFKKRGKGKVVIV